MLQKPEKIPDFRVLNDFSNCEIQIILNMSQLLEIDGFSLDPSCNEFSRFYSNKCIEEIKEKAVLCFERLNKYLKLLVVDILCIY